MSETYELIRLVKRRRTIYLILYFVVWILSAPIAVFAATCFPDVPNLFLYLSLALVVVTGTLAGLMELCCIGVGSLRSGKPSRGGLGGVVCLILSYFIFGWIIAMIANISDGFFSKMVGLG